MLVSAEWLAGHLKDPNLVVLALGQKADYDAGHIPGSLYVPTEEIRTNPGPGHPLSVELPPINDLAGTFGRLGVTNSSRVVLYWSSLNSAILTTRAFLTLDALGLGRNVALLDGGLPLWKDEQRPLTTDVRAVKAAKLQPCPQNDIIADVDFVRANLRHPGVAIVDARTSQYYTGESIPNGKRAGHIPGAATLPFNSLLDDHGKLKPAEQLQSLFQAAGIKRGDRVVSYCHIGLQATVVYFAARYLGYDARLYDGSWEDWSAHTELPAETSAPNRF